MKKLIYTLMLIFAVNEGLGQSVYSIPGIGELNYSNSVRIEALGGLGLALTDDIVVDIFNPCSIINLKNTSVFIGGSHSRVFSSYNSGDITQNLTRFLGGGFGFKVGENLGFAVSLYPYSDLNYNLKLKENDNITKSIRGRGGISYFAVTSAYRYKKIATIGLSFNYYFGNIDDIYRIDFEDNSYYEDERKVYTSLKGTSLTGGVIFNFTQNFSMGIVYQPGIEFSGEEGIKFYEDSTSNENSFKYQLPGSFGIGVLYKLNDRYKLNFDYFRNSFGDTKYDGVSTSYYNNSSHIGIGIEYKASEKEIDPYRKKIEYRLGFNCGNFYINDLNNKRVNEYYITTGVGFPFMDEKGRMDIALKIGKRGNKSLNPGEEKIIKFYISIAGGEKWFVERSF